MALFLSQELFSTQWNFFHSRELFFYYNLFFFYLLDIVFSSSVWSLTVSLRMTLNFRSPPALTGSIGLCHHLVYVALGIKLKAVPVRQTLPDTSASPSRNFLKMSFTPKGRFVPSPTPGVSCGSVYLWEAALAFFS